ncbi:HAD family hydrolase [Fluviispira vulneris]|uniref:HAD family hydrolase n=1 Tax=Fluviispira vulneris TaxID=2763012 RepID=UPI0016483B51|nr:HAD-IB family hydrolase [Fluviispira vulneris]
MINQNISLIECTYYNFFDVDETIIKEKSMFSFLRFYTIKMTLKFNIIVLLKYLYYIGLIKYLKTKKFSRNNINEIYYRFYRGVDINELNYYAHEWFDEVKEKSNFFNEKIISEINFHKSNGAKVIFVSGSFKSCLKPIADYIGIDDILCTKMEIINDKCTGKLLNMPVIGQGKSNIIKYHLLKNNFSNYSLCFAYGDHISDLPMLNFVGNPRVVPKCKKLLAHAKKNNWIIV